MTVELDEEILKDFLSETKENLEKLDEKFIELEQNPEDKELISSIFRIMHTIKGTSGFFGFKKLESISHAAEDILAKLRDGKVIADPEIIDILLKAGDLVKEIVSCIEKEKKEPEEERYERFVKEIREFADNIEERKKKEEKREEKEEDIRVTSVQLTETHIKVSIDLLDKLMNLAGELVLSRNRLVQIANRISNSELISATQELSLVTTELQEEIMKTRMQPIGTVFNKFPRIVRDLSKASGKKINLSIEGADTELDRSIIEAIKDPLTHIIRNSVDHGIETPEERIKEGKPPAGNILLKAYHEGGQVVIEIKDDGRGIDIEKIKKKAVEKGIISEAEALSLSEKEALNLIFRPGFSTADKVTNISGRGVGMDVVKTNIEKLGGSIDIQTEKGKGTTIRMKIPLTLAIIPALIVTCKGQRYAIPQVNLKELVILNEEEIRRDIQIIGNSKFYRLRDEIIPVFYLEEVLGLPFEEKKKKMSIVILNTGAIEFGLIVDSIWDSEEIVVKPLGKHFQGIPVYAGATLMGDGGIALILDVVGISSVLDIKVEEIEEMKAEMKEKIEKERREEQFFLIFQISDSDEYFAIPLALVARLDKIRSEQIEVVAGKEIIQYRNQSIPLIRLDRFIPVNPLSEKPEYNIILFDIGGKQIAFLASKIVDSIYGYFELDEDLYKFDGILGSAIVKDHTTLFVDVYKIIEMYDPEWIRKYVPLHTKRILLAEDSAFYRNLLRSYLTSLGYDVTTAKDGKEAWEKIKKYEFDVLVTDIVMPGMDGYELSMNVRNTGKDIPIIAVSSLVSEEDIKKGHDSGIDEYVPKLKFEELSGAIERIFEKRMKKAA